MNDKEKLEAIKEILAHNNSELYPLECCQGIEKIINEPEIGRLIEILFKQKDGNDRKSIGYVSSVRENVINITDSYLNNVILHGTTISINTIILWYYLDEPQQPKYKYKDFDDWYTSNEYVLEYSAKALMETAFNAASEQEDDN